MGWLSDLMAQNDPFEEEYQKKLYIKSFPSDLVEAMSTPPSIPEPAPAEPLQFLPENVEIARDAGLGPVPMQEPQPQPKNSLYEALDSFMGGSLPFGSPIQREEGFPGMEDFVGAGPEAPPIFPDDPVMKSLAMGWGDVAQSAGGAAKWLGKKELGDKWAESGQKLIDANQLTPGTPGEHGLGLSVVRSLPFTAALVPAAVAGAAGGAGLAGAAGLGTLGTALAGTAGAVGISRPLESLAEAGSVYNEAITKGWTEDQAAEAAKSTFLKNLPLAATDFIEIGTAFLGTKFLPKPLANKITGFMEGKFGRHIIEPAIKIAAPALMEGGEEAIQDAIQRGSLGDPNAWKWDEQKKMAAGAGAVMGGTMGGAGVVANLQAGQQEQPVQEEAAPAPLQKPVIEPVSYSGPVLGNIERPAGGAPIPQTAIPTPAIPPVSTPAAETQGVADVTGQAGVIVPTPEVNVPQTGGNIVEGAKETAPVEPKGLTPGTPEYNVAWEEYNKKKTAWDNEKQRTDEAAFKREETQKALELKNKWAQKALDWFKGAKAGDEIHGDIEGEVYVVTEETKTRNGKEVKLKTLRHKNRETAIMQEQDGEIVRGPNSNLKPAEGYDGTVMPPESDIDSAGQGIGKGLMEGTHKAKTATEKPAAQDLTSLSDVELQAVWNNLPKDEKGAAIASKESIAVLDEFKRREKKEESPTAEEGAKIEEALWGKEKETPSQQPTGQPEALSAKDPWQMTKEEYISEGQRSTGRDPNLPHISMGTLGNMWGKQHHNKVKQAIQDGKPVPAEVLKDYPDLTQQQESEPPEPEVSDVPSVEQLKAYAKEAVSTGEIKSVTLVGSAAVKGKITNDIDLLYDLGDRDLPGDSEWAAQEVEEIIESLKAPIDTETYDTFIQLGDRFFHVSSGAGRAVVENTSYAKEQLGKPTVVLAEAEAKETPVVTLADYGLSITSGTTKNGNPVWEVTGETKQYKDYFNKMGARWYGPKKSWSFYAEEDPTAKILAKLPKLEKKEEVTAKPDAKEQPTQPKYGRAGNAAYKKWGENERVNAKLDDLSDPYTQAYRKFFEAYYNAGLSGNKPRFDDSIKQELLKSGHDFPPFLEDVFYQAGVKDAEAKKGKEETKAPEPKPVFKDGDWISYVNKFGQQFNGRVVSHGVGKNRLEIDVYDGARHQGRVDYVRFDNLSLKRIESPLTEPTAAKQPADTQKEALQTGQDSGKVEEKGHGGPHVRIAEFVAQKLKSKEKFTSADLFREADKAYGGGQAQGKYTPKDAYDALELGVNKYLEDQLVIDSTLDAEHARSNLKSLEVLLELLPTQTKRTAEQDEFQQFSTPPNLAYVAAWAANFSKGDTVLEPSAGIGGLAVFAKKAGAEVAVNELSKRRLELLKEMGFDEVFNEDAEQIDNILPDSVKPTVVIMNPPFSATAGRMQGVRSTKFAEAHIGQALSRLEPDGRLVAIVGRGMSDSAATFRDWWKKIKAEYNVRANIGIDGSNYKKYGTSFDVQLLVIDKTGATPEGATITGSVTKLEDVLPLLEVVRNDRTANRPAQQAAGEPTGKKASQAGEAEAGPGSPVSISIAEVGAGERGSEKPGGRESTRERGPSGRGGASAAAEPAESDGLSVEGRPGGRESVGEAGTAGEVEETSGRGGVSAGQDESSTGRKRAEPESGIKVESQEAQTAGEELTDAVFTAYTPQKLKIPGAKQHPGHLAQSAAMAAVEPPTPTYAPNLPKEVIKEGKLSIAQLESIVYAGQAHQQTLPNGQRRGFFIGDGTGVGKGREISGIILDNMRQGRKKAVWISKNNPLFADAKRDFGDIGGNTDLLFELGKIKQGMPVKQKEGVIFTTYNTLSQNLEVSRDGELAIKKDKQARIDQIVNWLGKDFDGVIAFDEAHHMQNSLAMKGKRGMTKPSAMALAGVELQKRLPNARIVYVSATGATEVANLAYASRLGLWGEGTAFADNRDFVSQVQAGGLATMELVARDMKAMGAYLARSLSFDGVTYGTIQHELSGEQLEIYDAMAEGWQTVLQNIHEALEETGQQKNGNAKANAMSRFWGSQQRFFNQILTSMQMPSALEAIKKDLKDGHAVVMQLVNTNEAAQNRQISKMEEGDSLEDLDLTPRDMLMQYIEKGFPTQQYEEYMDDNGNIRTRPVFDSQGRPVHNRQAVAMKEALLDKIGSMKVPEGPLEIIINTFGAENVAEITGRTRRIVRVKDGSGKLVAKKETRTPKHAEADANAFMDDKKKILVFSDAGGTGRSYHASLTAKNQRRRVHYLIQPGWRADNAVQGFGRTHRTNQANTPHYVLVTTNLKGQKRFISSIARRLDQLGALTKGQRQTGSQGLFSAKDNLESGYAKDALQRFYEDLVRGQIKGFNPQELLNKMGLDRMLDDQVNLKEAPELRDITKFLNRILALESSLQNDVFDAFSDRLDAIIERAIETGTLDVGLENFRADKVNVLDEKTVYTDEISGAETKYIELEASYKNKPLSYGRALKLSRLVGVYRNTRSGRVYAVRQRGMRTTQSGSVVYVYELHGQSEDNVNSIDKPKFDAGNWEEAKGEEAQKAWNEALDKLPEYRDQKVHLITGAILPIWDRLPAEQVRVIRVKTDDGRVMLGRIIPDRLIDTTLSRLNVQRNKQELSPAEIARRILEDNYYAELANGWRIVRKGVSGEYRIEIIGGDLYRFADQLKKDGVFTERIQFNTRYFIPSGEDAAGVFSKVTAHRPVVDVVSPDGLTYGAATNAGSLREKADVALANNRPGGQGEPSRGIRSMLDVHSPQKTSIKQVAAGLRIGSTKGIFKEGMTVVDMGGGLWEEGTKYLAEKGIKSLVYDPYARTKEHNDKVIETLEKNGGADAAALNNVLNVIPTTEERADVLKYLYQLMKPGGKAVITVYEGNKSGKGAKRVFGDGTSTWQENRRLASYEEEIRKALPGAELEKRFGAFVLTKPATEKKAWKAVRSRAGKVVGQDTYIHKSAMDALTESQQNQVETAQRSIPADFGGYEVIKVSKDGAVSFIKSPDWDTAPEPRVGDSVKISPDKSPSIFKGRDKNWQIYHHKWMFVKDDYKGFDVGESKARSEQWKNSGILEAGDLARIGNNDFWQQNVVSKLGGKAVKGSAGTHAREKVQGMANPVQPPTPKNSTPAKDTIRRRDIIRFLNAKLAPIRTGRFRNKALGIFKVKPEVIRSRLANDLPTISHEIGHYLDKRLELSNNHAYDQELITLGQPQSTKKYTKEQVREEGVAEFIRLYLTDPQQAKQEAPNYFAAFEDVLDVHEDIKDILLTAQKDIELWYNQPAEARVAGAISVDESNNARRMTLDRLYSLTIDELDPLKRFTEQIGGKDAPVDKNPFLRAWLARGWNGKAEALLHYGVMDKNGKKVGKSLDEVLAPVKDDLDGFRNYAVAKHSLEVTAQGKHTGILDADAEEVVKNAPKKYQDVLENLVQYQDALLNLLVESGVMKAESVTAMRETYPNYVPFYRVFDEDVNTVAAYMSKGGFANLRNPVKAMKGSMRDIVDPIESIIKNTYTFVNIAERNAVGRSIVELAEGKEGMGRFVEKVDATHNVAKENILTVYRDGKAEKYQLDPDLYRATLALDREASNILIKILSYPASWLRAGATLSPDFMIRNPIRDQFSAFINSKYGYIPGIDLVKGIFHAIKKDELYWQYQNSGAAHSSLVAIDRDYLQKDIKKFFKEKTTKEKVVTVVNPGTYIEMLRALSELGEYGTRLGEFAKGVKKGASFEEAALSARDLTLDFARVGSHMKHANRVIAFMNATIQGSDKIVRQFRANPKGSIIKTAAAITLPSIILFLLNHDDDRYKELPQWQKDMFWIVLTKDHIFRIPKPFELGILFGTVPERILGWVLDKDPKAFRELGKTLKDAITPGYIPTALLPVIEVWANKSFFTSLPIVPEREKSLEPKYQFGPYTTETAKAIGSLLNWSPRKIESFLRGYTGGLGLYTIKLIEGTGEATGLMSNKNKPALAVADYPVIKSFMVKQYASPQSVEDFYAELNELEKKYSSTKQTKQLLINQEEYDRLKLMRKVADKLSEIRKAEREIQSSKELTPAQKRRALENADKLTANVARAALGKGSVK